jgi:hypothetical protein
MLDQAAALGIPNFLDDRASLPRTDDGPAVEAASLLAARYSARAAR